MLLDQLHFSALTNTTFQYIKDAMDNTLSMCYCKNCEIWGFHARTAENTSDLGGDDVFVGR